MTKTKKGTKGARGKLITALIELLKDQPYNKIQIVDICEKANLSRQSYYCVFKEKDEILTTYIDNFLGDAFDSFSKSNKSLDAFIDCVVDAFANEREFAQLIFKNKLDNLLIYSIENLLNQINEVVPSLPSQFDVAKPFFSYGIIGVIKHEFAKNGGDFNFDIIKPILVKLMNGRYLENLF